MECRPPTPHSQSHVSRGSAWDPVFILGLAVAVADAPTKPALVLPDFRSQLAGLALVLGLLLALVKASVAPVGLAAALGLPAFRWRSRVEEQVVGAVKRGNSLRCVVGGGRHRHTNGGQAENEQLGLHLCRGVFVEKCKI